MSAKTTPSAERDVLAQDLVMSGRFETVEAAAEALDLMRGALTEGAAPSNPPDDAATQEALHALLAARRDGPFITEADMRGVIERAVARKRALLGL